MRFTRLLCVFGFATAFITVHAFTASGQETATRTSASPAWEVDFHAGLSRDTDQANGKSSIPATATTVQGIVSASTFAFGNATTLFNENRPTTPIVSLNPVLAALAAKTTAGLSFGVRLQRSVGVHYGIEVAADYLRNHLAFRPSTLTGLEATRASYEAALASTLALSGESSSASSATTLTDDALATRMVITGALVRKLRPFGQTTPYLLAGGGVMFTQDNSLAATLTTSYQFGTTSYVVGSDAVVLRVEAKPRTAVGLFGGGFKHTISPHFGLRADARLTLYQATHTNVVRTSATMGAQSLGPTLPLLAINGLQFAPVAPFTQPAVAAATFTESGPRANMAVTAGLFIRF